MAGCLWIWCGWRRVDGIRIFILLVVCTISISVAAAAEGTIVVIVGTNTKGKEAKAREKVDVPELGRSVSKTRIKDGRIGPRIDLLSPSLMHLWLNPLSLWSWWNIRLDRTWILFPFFFFFL